MKIMKQLRSLEMRSIKEKKIKFVFFLFSFFLFGCKQPLENKILGTWEIDHVSFSDGTLSTVPIDERYTMVISKKANKKNFKVDDIQGSWYIEDSLLFFENIPQSKTYIDSIFVVNDQWGSSSIVLQNGDQKIASIQDGVLKPEKVISKMKIISVKLEELNLLIEKNKHTYIKLN